MTSFAAVGAIGEIGLDNKFLTLIRHFADAVMSRILPNKPGATVILEKTPDHIRNWRNLF